MVDLASGAETVRTEPRPERRGDRALRARGARVHDLRRHGRAGLADPRPGRDDGPRRSCSTSTAARTTRGTAPPTDCTSTTRSSSRAAGPFCCSTRAAATATARPSTTACSARGATADAKDFLEPIDQLVAEGIADPERLAVTGYSYGGFMTCYLTSRDDRFAAAVAGGVVSDLVSMAGTSDAGHFLSELRAAGPCRGQTRDRYEAMSPLAGVDAVRTPTLDLPRRGRRALPRRPGPAVAHGAARARRADPARALPGRVAPVPARGPPVAPRSTSTAASSTGSSSTPATARARPIDAAHWQRRLDRARRAAPRARRDARHPARAARAATTSSSSSRPAS